MRGAVRLILFGFALMTLGATAVAQQQDVIASIQVQGNTLTPDDEVIRASGLSQGAAFSDEQLSTAADRLQATKRFDHVDVLKRYASITDPTQIVVLIRVDEGPVRVVPGVLPGQPPRVKRRSRINLMFVPVLDAEDGYGFTYGAQFAVTGNSSTSSRVAFPMTWGGDKRAAIEFQQEFTSKLAPRVRTGAVVQRRTHPFFDSDADRKRVWGRAEWQVVRPLRAGTTMAWQQASLVDRQDTTRSLGADFVLDTRLDPLLPRNAIYARAVVDRLSFRAGLKPDPTSLMPGRPSSIVRTELEADGYIGVYRETVLVLHAVREDMSRSAPPFFKSILGGASNLRGFRAGTAIGDTLVAGSMELRIPLTSPLNVAKFGTSVFMDIGTTYDKGQRFHDQRLRRGAGAGVWATAALFRISLVVAHGIGADTRIHFGAGLTF